MMICEDPNKDDTVIDATIIGGFHRTPTDADGDGSSIFQESQRRKKMKRTLDYGYNTDNNNIASADATVSIPPPYRNNERLCLLELHRLLYCIEQQSSPPDDDDEGNGSSASLVDRQRDRTRLTSQDWLIRADRLRMLWNQLSVSDQTSTLKRRVEAACSCADKMAQHHHHHPTASSSSSKNHNDDNDLLQRLFYSNPVMEPPNQEQDQLRHDHQRASITLDQPAAADGDDDSSANKDEDDRASHRNATIPSTFAPSTSTFGGGAAAAVDASSAAMQELQQEQRKQMEDAISQMAAQLKEQTSNIHQTLQTQNTHLSSMEVQVEETTIQVGGIAKDVQHHVQKGWARTVGTWTMLFTMVGVFVVLILIILMVPKRPGACLFFCSQYRHRPSTGYVDNDSRFCRMVHGRLECLDEEHIGAADSDTQQESLSKNRQEDSSVLDEEDENSSPLLPPHSSTCELQVNGECIDPESPIVPRNDDDNNNEYSTGITTSESSITQSQNEQQPDNHIVEDVEDGIIQRHLEHEGDADGSDATESETSDSDSEDDYAPDTGDDDDDDDFIVIPQQPNQDDILREYMENYYQASREQAELEHDEAEGAHYESAIAYTEDTTIEGNDRPDDDEDVDYEDLIIPTPDDVLREYIENYQAVVGEPLGEDASEGMALPNHGDMALPNHGETLGGHVYGTPGTSGNANDETDGFLPRVEDVKVHDQVPPLQMDRIMDDGASHRASSNDGVGQDESLGDKLHATGVPIYNGRPFSSRDVRKAAAGGDVALLDAYLSAMPEWVDKADKNGWNSLHLAARAGHVDVVKLLLKYDSNLNSETLKGETALDITAQRLGGDHPVVKLLQSRDMQENQ